MDYMSLAQCPECWDDNCSCGYKYRNWDEQSLRTFLEGLLKYNNKAESVFELKECSD